MQPECMPSHAAWFRGFDVIDDIEQRALPEFFDGRCPSKTPDMYIHMRNLIISEYQDSPTQHLSVTECRRRLAADVGTVMRVHALLEHWGLINHSVDRSASGEAHCDNGVIMVSGGWIPPPPVDFTLRAPLTFGGCEWTPQETLALIEALEVLGSDGGWDEVAAQVGRSAEECVGHLVSLPMEEPHQALEQPDVSMPGTSCVREVATVALQPALVEGICAEPTIYQLALLAHAVGKPFTSTSGDMDLDIELCARVVEAAGAEGTVSTSVQQPFRAAAYSCAASILAQALSRRPVKLTANDELSKGYGTLIDMHVQLLEAKLENLDELTYLMRMERAHAERSRAIERAVAATVHFGGLGV